METTDKLDFAIPEGLVGEELRELLITFQRTHSNINKARDDAQLDKDLVDLAISSTMNNALLEIDNWDKTDRGSSSEARKAQASQIPIPQGKWSTSDTPKTIQELERDLVVATYRVRRAASRLRELESAVDVIRSALAWDRREWEKGGHS